MQVSGIVTLSLLRCDTSSPADNNDNTDFWRQRLVQRPSMWAVHGRRDLETPIWEVDGGTGYCSASATRVWSSFRGAMECVSTPAH